MKLTLEFFKTTDKQPKIGDNIIILGKGNFRNIDDWSMSSYIINESKLNYLVDNAADEGDKYWAYMPLDQIKFKEGVSDVVDAVKDGIKSTIEKII